MRVFAVLISTVIALLSYSEPTVALVLLSMYGGWVWPDILGYIVRRYR